MAKSKGVSKDEQRYSEAELKDRIKRLEEENEGLRYENKDLKENSGLLGSGNDEEDNPGEITRIIRPAAAEPIDEYESGIQRERIINQIKAKNLNMGTDQIRAYISSYDPKNKKRESLGYEDIYDEEDIPDDNMIGEKYGAGQYTIMIKDSSGIITKYALNLSERRFAKKTGESVKLSGINDPLLLMLQQSAEKAEAMAAEARRENRDLMLKILDFKNQPSTSVLNDPSVIMKLIDVSSKNQPDMQSFMMKMLEKGIEMKERIAESDDEKSFFETIKSVFTDMAKAAIPKGKDIITALTAVQQGAPVEIKKLSEVTAETAPAAENTPEKISLTADQIRIMNENILTLSFFSDLNELFNDIEESDHNDILNDMAEKVTTKPLYLHIGRHINQHKDNYIEILKLAIPDIKNIFIDEKFKNYVILLIRKVIEISGPKVPEIIVENPGNTGEITKKG